MNGTLLGFKSNEYGWDYKKGNGEESSDTYFEGIAYNQWYVEVLDKAALTGDTDAQKKQILNDATKQWFEAVLSGI